MSNFWLILLTKDSMLDDFEKLVERGIDGKRFWSIYGDEEEGDIVVFVGKKDAEPSSPLDNNSDVIFVGRIMRKYGKESEEYRNYISQTSLEIGSSIENSLNGCYEMEVLFDKSVSGQEDRVFERDLEPIKRGKWNYYFYRIKDNSETKETIQELIKVKIVIRSFYFADRNLGDVFYSALKVKGFVILAGLSGTGKTRLFEEFVRLFGSEARKLFIPVRPDFRDTKSLLGFYNPITGKYHKTELLDFIIEASKSYIEGDRKPYFVLFDEMNLAKVEYYFSDFLSVMESKRFESSDEAGKNEKFVKFLEKIGKSINDVKDKNRYRFTVNYIPLEVGEDDKKDSKVNDEEKIPRYLFLPPNLYFVGTVNVDETTYMFSPKVLDRAFVIEFEGGDIEKYFDSKYPTKDGGERTNTVSASGVVGNSQQGASLSNSSVVDNTLGDNEDDITKKIVDFIKKGDFVNSDYFVMRVEEIKKNECFNDFVKFLKECNISNNNVIKILKAINEKLPNKFKFGYRVVDEIVMFLYYWWKLKEGSNDCNSVKEIVRKGLDYAVLTKVLPKINGTVKQIGSSLEELSKTLERYGLSKSKEKCDSMNETLKSQGFVSYI